MVLELLDTHRQTHKQPDTPTSTHSQLITGLNVKFKPLEGNTGENPYDLGFGNNF